MTCPRIGISLGDPGGVGPEVVLKALARPDCPPDLNIELFGSPYVLERTARLPGIAPGWENLRVHTINAPETHPPVLNRPDPENGRASFMYFEQAAREAEAGRLDAVVTAPISKHSWKLAGIPWAGHTDFLSHRFPDALMSFFSDRLKIVLFSHHIPLRQALDLVRSDQLEEFFLRVHRLLNTPNPRYRFLVAGINPHAGEEGLLGREEIDEIIPALEAARSRGVPITGPIPPDTICRAADRKEDTIVLSLYHDQGLIAFKLACFEDGVNVTLGLPFIRTSPDHGTAFDIAGQGTADPTSMLAAIRFAHQLGSVRPSPE